MSAGRDEWMAHTSALCCLAPLCSVAELKIAEKEAKRLAKGSKKSTSSKKKE